MWSASIGAPRSMSRSIDAAKVEPGVVNMDRLRDHDGFAWRKALRCGDRRAFARQCGREICGVRRDDVADGRSHQAGDAGHGGDEHPLFPHLLQDGRR